MKLKQKQMKIWQLITRVLDDRNSGNQKEEKRFMETKKMTEYLIKRQPLEDQIYSIIKERKNRELTAEEEEKIA